MRLTGGGGGGGQVGQTFRDCAECPLMVEVPSGSFTMGSPSSESGRDSDEGPQHEVRIGYRLAVGVYEVTRGEFARFVAATGYDAGNRCRTYESGSWDLRSGRSWRDPGFSQTDSHPVVCVDWDAAQAYVAWLSNETGHSYRLLSESEWEYVARAGTSTARYWGNRSQISVIMRMGRTAIRTLVGVFRAMTGMPARHRWVVIQRTTLVCMMCWATRGSGRRIAGMAAIQVRHRMGRRGSLGPVGVVCCAAVLGSTDRGSSARPIAPGTTPASATTSTVFVFPGCSPLKSLPLYLFKGGLRGGCAPPYRFFTFKVI